MLKTVKPELVSTVEIVPQETMNEQKLVSDLESGEKITLRDIKWVNLNFSAGKSTILDNCWGEVKSGQVCAIMGPSGAGKSSLLNVLAGRSSTAPGIYIEGKITVGGKVINPVAFRKNIAYVMQEDALLATATPREALIFSANMRLPSSITREKISELVERLLEELGIMNCADVMIGGPLIKGISGGQKKRTSVGVELITNPQLLFLDEPTSGLDSYSAHSLVVLLKKVARRNFIFLKEGRIFYQGPVQESIQYFTKFGYSFPSLCNPCDVMMDLCQTVTVTEAEEKGIFQSCPVSLLDSQESTKLMSENVTFIVESSFFKQFRILVHREVTRVIRDKRALIGRYGVTFVLSLLYGLIFLGIGGSDSSSTKNIQSHFGAVSIILISCMFGAAWPMMLSFPFERPMFLREYSTGTYGANAYFLSKLFIEIFVQFCQQLLMFLLVYFMIDLQGNFILEVFIAWGLAMATNSVAIALGCALSDVKSVTELSPLLLVPQMLFLGLYIKTSQIPNFIRWAEYLCSLKYAMNLFLLVEFDNENPHCRSSEVASENCASLLSDNDVTKGDFYIYIIILFVLFVGFRAAGAYILAENARKFY